MPRILLAEDDPDIAQLVQRYLEKDGFTVEATETGRDVVAKVKAEPTDLVVLDLMLPGVDGLTLCRTLRGDSSTAAIPIIMLTAKAAEADRIAGLELGADDYITKPFSPKELVARVRALLRRTERRAPTAGTLNYGPLSIDLDRHVVLSGRDEVRLTAKEFLLLQYLVTHRGRVLSRDLLLSDVWDYSYTGGTRTVDVHVRRLREKLPFLIDALATVKQFGYKLLDPAPGVQAGPGGPQG